MILDEIADVFDKECEDKGIRNVSKKTGLATSKIYSLRSGCSFVLNTGFIAALASLGYEIHIQKRRK